jgi:Mg-chelatase subunit ChlD
MDIVNGSLQAIAESSNQSLAQSFLSADAIVLVDVSSSMAEIDTRGGKSRYTVACQELAKLQARLPGKVAVIAFSSSPTFSPGGIPPFTGGGTDLAEALRFVHVADDVDMTFVIISDGEPNDEEKALKEARHFKSKIDTIYIGLEAGQGAAFLMRLADASGGRSSKNNVGDLSRKVEQLLLTAG